MGAAASGWEPEFAATTALFPGVFRGATDLGA
jgi:hypothetical protein